MEKRAVFRSVRLLCSISLIGLMITPAAALGANRMAIGEPKNPTVNVEREKAEVALLAQAQQISLGEARQRLDRQQRAHSLNVQLKASLKSRYGGMWIDQQHGGRLKVGVIGDRTTVRGIATRHALADVVATVAVRYSHDHLMRIADRIGADLVRLNSGVAWPLASGVITDRNAVELELPRGRQLTPHQKMFVRSVQRKYGSAVRLAFYQNRAVPLSCWLAAAFCDVPLRGGVHIQCCTDPSRNYCTAGFMAAGGSIPSNRYVITAGHCVPYDRLWWTYDADFFRHDIGNVFDREFSSRGDAGIIKVVNTSYHNPKPWVITNSFNATGKVVYPDEDYVIRDGDGASSDILGEWVCKSGTTTLTSCGTVGSYGSTLTYGGVTVRNMGRADRMCSAFGDSGSPVFVGGTAYGIAGAGVDTTQTCVGDVGGSYDRLYYTGVRSAQALMNVNILEG